MAAVEVNWHDYFESIKAVCPWSLQAHRNNLIDIVEWQGIVFDLGNYEARIYTSKHNARQLKKIHNRLNEQRPEEEWLWSHPSYEDYSAPVPCLIQQDRAKLYSIRSKIGFFTDKS